MADQGPLNFDPFAVILLAIVAGYVGVGVAAAVWKRPWPMLTLNLIFALGIVLLGAVSGGFTKLFGMLGLLIMAIELAAITAAIAGFRKVSHTILVSWIVFGWHGVLLAAATYFALTFRMTRLF